MPAARLHLRRHAGLLVLDSPIQSSLTGQSSQHTLAYVAARQVVLDSQVVLHGVGEWVGLVHP
jgi:hypothetical protein